LNYTTPTQIQKKSIPIILKGIDLIGGSKSGTGKTATYLIPMIQKLSKLSKGGFKTPKGLVIVPTVELANQVNYSFEQYSKNFDLQQIVIKGGVKKSIQIEQISQGVDIVIATPGRLIELIQENKIDMKKVGFVVLDEADTMLELGFLKEITFILSHCAKPRQIVMFSATISQNIKKLAKEFLYEPVTVQVHDRRDIVDLIEHKAYKVDRKRRMELCRYLIKKDSASQILVFVNTKEVANELFEYLYNKNIRVATIHSDIKKQDRAKALTMLRGKKIETLIATDIAARGIDIPELPLVINYELPETTDDFTHRVGRTGRANHKGKVITILSVNDLNKFTKIERDLKLNVKREIVPGFELTDRQPRLKQQKKKSLREKKGYVDYTKKRRRTNNTNKKRY